MRIKSKLKCFLVASFAIFVLNGCSSAGNTATGLGLGVGGNWFGNLLVNNVLFATFSMTLLQSATSADDPFAPSTLSGNLATNHECLGSGTIEGSLNANQISLTVSLNNGAVLNLAGVAGNSSMSGGWSNNGGTSSGEVAEGETAAVVCSGGGSWNARR
jgi:hypothetical protein